MTVPRSCRSDSEVIVCGDDARGFYYDILDSDFYRLSSEDAETFSEVSTASVEDPDKKEFDSSTVLSGADSVESDDPSFLISVDDEKLAVQATLQSGCWLLK